MLALAIVISVGKAPDASPGITPEGEEETSAGAGGNKKRDEGILKGLKAINSSIDGIIRALTDGTKEDKKAADTARKETEKRKRKGAESALEKIGGVALKGIQSVIKPAMGIFQRIWEFIKTVFLGRIVMMFFDWMSKNQGKLASMFKFIKDWWPVMVAGILAIFGPILGPVGWVVGVGALVWWGFNRIQAVIKFITGIFKGVFDFLTFGLFKGKDDPKKIGDSVLKDTESEFQGGDFTGQDDSGLESAPSDATQQMEGGQEAVDESQRLQAPTESGDQPEVGMNKGGVVPGTGNTDTVPAKLTPGEFVMSKGAVQQYGVDTLENMNAAAGGTNVPTEMPQDGQDGASGRDANVVISQPKTPKVKGYEGGGEVKAEEGGGKEGGDKKKKGMGLGGILIKMLETNPLFKLILIPLIKGVKRLITGVHNTLHEEKEGAAGAAGKDGAAGVGVAGVEGAAGKEGKTGAGVIAAGKDGDAGVAGTAGTAGAAGKSGVAGADAKSKKMSLAQTMFAPHMKIAKGVGGLMMKHPLAQMAKGVMNNPMVQQMGGMIKDSPLGKMGQGIMKGVMGNPLVKGFMSTMGLGGEDKKDPLAPSTGAAGDMKLARIQKPKESPPPPPKDRSTVAYEKAQQQQQQQATAEPPRQDLPYFNASAMVSMSKVKTLGITV